MTRITFTAEEQHEDIIEDVRQDIDTESTAAAVRECIERASILQQREADLQQRIDDLQQENERLQGEHEEQIEKIRQEHEAEIEEIRQEHEEQIADLERENERLQRQLIATNKRVEEHTELVRTVERQQSLAERKASAGVLTRAKWWLVGMSDDEKED